MEWKKLISFPSYEISEYGDIRRISPGIGNGKSNTYVGKILKSQKSKNDNHYFVKLFVNRRGFRKFVHVLACEAFHGEKPFHAAQVRHLDGNGLNNFYKNLLWGTERENHDDTKRLGSKKGIRNGNAHLVENDIHIIDRLYYMQHSKQSNIATIMGITQAHVSAILRRESWAHVPRLYSSLLHYAS